MRKLYEIIELVAVIIFVIICHAAGKHENQFSSGFVKGHRGSGAGISGNTISSMYSALKEGVTTLKMDVLISHEGKVLVSNEPVTHQGLISNKQLLGNLIDSVEYFVSVSGIDPPLYSIEITNTIHPDSSFHPDMMDMVMDVIYLKEIGDRVSVQSFEVPHLQHINRYHPDIATAFLLDETEERSVDHFIDELGFVPQVLSPHYSLVNPELIDICHNKGMKIIPWIVNDKNTINTLKELGVDGIISDFPHLFN